MIFFCVCKNDIIEKILVYSVEQGKLIIIKYLKKLDNKKVIPFHIKYIYDFAKLTNCLLLFKHGVDMNKINKKESTLLHVATKIGYNNVVKKLVEKRVDINIKDRNG